MINAKVKNAKAKPIERFFGTLKNNLSRLDVSFCGGNITERPENLNKILKKGELSTDAEIRKRFETIVNGMYNIDPYGGSEKKYKGLSRIGVWNKSIKKRTLRKVAAADLALLLARVTRYQKIGRKGVYAFSEDSRSKLWYVCENLHLHQGKEVYVRYDPSDPRTVRVYGRENDKYSRLTSKWV